MYRLLDSTMVEDMLEDMLEDRLVGKVISEHKRKTVVEGEIARKRGDKSCS